MTVRAAHAAGPRRRRPARPRPAGRLPRCVGVGPRRAGPDRPGVRSIAGRGASSTWCSTPRRTPPSMRPRPRGPGRGVDRQRRAPAALARLAPAPASRWCTSPPTTSSTGPGPSTREDEPLVAAGRLRPIARPPVRSRSGPSPRHYVVRTSWLIGDGSNFVRTMDRSLPRAPSPTVVDDQVGRLTFADDLARATRHLLDQRARRTAPTIAPDQERQRPGPMWPAGLPALRPRPRRRDAGVHRGVRRRARLAPRPLHSTMSLAKLEDTGFRPRDAWEALTDYLTGAPW